jgi:hypothetical protein
MISALLTEAVGLWDQYLFQVGGLCIGVSTLLTKAVGLWDQQ